ncbi:MAG: DUF5011 domain-containing protein [Eubacterium sp.]|nr:DUF5011 domain-containing protein [Eubacterium sp.]
MAAKKKQGSVLLRVVLALLALFVLGGVFLFFFWDRTPPEVIPVDQTIDYGGKLKIEDLVEANDNRAKEVALTFESVDSEDVEVSEDGTVFTFPKVGEYKIKITGRDDFKNKATTNVIVKVLDETPPEFVQVEKKYTVVYGEDIPVVNVAPAEDTEETTETTQTPAVTPGNELGSGDTADSENDTTEAKDEEKNDGPDIVEQITVSVKDAASENILLSVNDVRPLEKQGEESYFLEDGKVIFSRIGGYELEIKAEDESGNIAMADALVEVLDKTAPVFAESEESYEVAYGKEIKVVQKDKVDSTKNTIFVKAVDEISAVSLKIAKVEPQGKLKEDSFTLDKGVAVFHKLGTYEVTIKAADESKNTAKKTMTVTVVDKTKPEFDGLPKSISLTDKDTDYNWKQGVTAKDEVDGDLTKTIEIKSKAVKFGIPGTYMVAYLVKDAAGNKEEKTVKVIIEDKTPPVLSVPQSFTVKVGDPAPDYAKGVKAKDAVDGEVKVNIDTSKVDLTKPGTYKVTYSAGDKSGNMVSKVSTVTVEQ